MTLPIDKLLPRLSRVKRTGPARWMASCPTREDRSPSLSIREEADGRLLIHDFGGDDVEAICAAVGLQMSDLFPEELNGMSAPPVKRRFSAMDLIDLAAFEAGVAMVVMCDFIAGKDVSNGDLDRFFEAARRLGDVAEAARA